ncbi:MAG TPA: hypothetical protein ENN63_06565 [Bacteroidetes bacterium]|nr:hypothetical protein [Bacteroidota bacterium]
MIYTFRLISTEADDFVRDMEIGAGNSFLTFHTGIQKALRYDPSQLASFFLCDNEWNRLKEITLLDMYGEEKMHTLTMQEAIISHYVSSKGDKLQYLFDFFSDRALFIELVDTEPAGDPLAPPFVIREKGIPPQQIVMDVLSGDVQDFAETDNDDDIDDEDLLIDPDDLERL